ncbi:P-loop containing nucleoside triphosphate hydrolase protein [Multifurca ochricompacta]|uniref:P-loop containing nucleoside triphosphate hydrolase protein n=1 Tax=Multifurca ochricompacta TaxID=376703 RepID=A0AAD4QLE7_9AGAM|nr:P-loop containing nucleoside triphosphate hydrolase protein [Multifurca ochricompacta]
MALQTLHTSSSDVSTTSPLVWPVHIEVRLSPSSTARFDTVRNAVRQYVSKSFETIALPSRLDGWEDVPVLASSVEQITACESSSPTSYLPVAQAFLQIHVYQPTDGDSVEGFSTGSTSDGEDSRPLVQWEGLWDSLIFPDDTKSRLLDYIYATVLFSDANVDFNIVSWNRVVLLHGPPGTGKTSLCRALAQKLSVRLSHRYPQSRLLEINSHSLFSRWFSESGKLVQKLFGSVMELVEDEDTFVVVLIDEVESLTAARAGAMAGTEPTDALRVVNALLTQLDKLRHKKNVLVVSTSNLAKAIAIYIILRSCLLELIAKGVVPPPLFLKHLQEVPSLEEARYFERTTDQKMSGRSLRRLPVLAHARYISLGYAPPAFSVTDAAAQKDINGGKATVSPGPGGVGTQVEVWLNAMEKVVGSQAGERERFEQ